MAKFKVGDRVRFTEACNNEWRFGPHTKFKDGVIVKDNASGFPYTVKTDNGDGYVNESHIELVAKEPKFKVGDVVKYVDGRDGARCNKDGARGTITAVRDRSYHFNDGLISRDVAEKYGGDYELELVATAKAIPENTTKTTETPKAGAERHSIVALIEHGKPRPNKNPYVHATADAATKEAERLAGKYPGQEFGVYQLVTARIGTVSVAEA